MRRRLLNFAATVILVIALAIAVLGTTTFWRPAYVSFAVNHTRLGIVADQGQIGVWWFDSGKPTVPRFVWWGFELDYYYWDQRWLTVQYHLSAINQAALAAPCSVVAVV